MASQSRISAAIDDGSLTLPDGDVKVVRPPLDFDFSPFVGRGVTIQHGFAPIHDAFASSGYNMSAGFGDATTVCVVAQRSKDFTRSLIADAAAHADLILVDGHKTDGVDSHYKAIRKTLGDVPSITKAHGRLFWFSGTRLLDDWSSSDPVIGNHGFYTLPGVFSDGAVDKGSQALLDALPEDLSGRLADFGAGWGFLSQALLQRSKVENVDLIEAEVVALDCARLNVTDARASFIWGDATTYRSADPYDAVIMNPPFHVGRSGDPSLGQTFIASAAANLKANGQLWMVANRHLPYEAQLDAKFKDWREVSGNAAFKVFRASRPRR